MISAFVFHFVFAFSFSYVLWSYFNAFFFTGTAFPEFFFYFYFFYFTLLFKKDFSFPFTKKSDSASTRIFLCGFPGQMIGHFWSPFLKGHPFQCSYWKWGSQLPLSSLKAKCSISACTLKSQPQFYKYIDPKYTNIKHL